MCTSVVQQLLQALGEQQVPQSFHLGLQLSDQFGVWIFVDHGVTADLFGAVSISGEAGHTESEQSQTDLKTHDQIELKRHGQQTETDI